MNGQGSVSWPVFLCRRGYDRREHRGPRLPPISRGSFPEAGPWAVGVVVVDVVGDHGPRLRGAAASIERDLVLRMAGSRFHRRVAPAVALPRHRLEMPIRERAER